MRLGSVGVGGEVRGWGQCGIGVSGGWRGSEGVGSVWDWGQWGLEGK